MNIIKINDALSSKLKNQDHLSGRYFSAEFRGPTFIATIVDPKTGKEIQIHPIDYFDLRESEFNTINVGIKNENLKEIKELRKCIKVYHKVGSNAVHIKERLDILIKSL